MQRKELKKAIKEFSHKTNFYELGLIRRLLKHRYKKELNLINKIPKVKCPCCGSYKIVIDNDGSEYSVEDFLTCENCWESFDDNYGYIDSLKDYDLLCWTYEVDRELHFEEPDIKEYRWQELCRSLILRELNQI